MWVILKLFVGSHRLHTPIMNYTDTINQVQKVDSVRHQDARLLLQTTLKDFAEDVFAHVCIQSGNRIVEEDDVSV